MATTIFFRAPGSRIEHFTRDRATTLCGKDAKVGAKFAASERGQDAKVRPLCPACRAAAAVGE